MLGEPSIILLIEDNPDHAELVKRSLSDHRVANKIIHVQDGQTALDYLFRRNAFADSETNPLPHLILLDLHLPRIDGLEVLAIIKDSAELQNIPVVILTTSEAEKDIHRAYAHCANSYLIKPIGFEEFNQMIHDLGFYWLGWNTRPNLTSSVVE
jgi:CheY-like chemotaxis protein